MMLIMNARLMIAEVMHWLRMLLATYVLGAFLCVCVLCDILVLLLLMFATS